MRTEEHDDCVRAFADAGVDADLWPAALRRLSSATRSNLGELIGIGNEALSFGVSELPQEAYRDHDAIDGHSHRTSFRVAAAVRAAPMKVVGDNEYDSVIPTLRTDAYRDVVRKYDIQHGCQTTLLLKPGLLVGMSVLRTRREGRADPETIAAFAALAPHALAAVRTRLALGDRSVRDMVSALEHADVVAFVCHADGTVGAMTGRAEQVVRSGGPLTLRARRLSTTHPPDGPVLQRAMVAATGAPSGAASAVIGPESHRTAVHVRALPASDWGLTFQPRLLVILRQGAGRPTPEVLRAAFGLTAAEAQIALELAAGHPRERIALQRGVSLGTLRQQIKAIFAKAGVSREAELVLAVQGLG